MTTPVLYVASNPKDGVTTFQNVRIQRAPDSSGSPGAFADVVVVAIDSTAENTIYTDTAASALTDWYRHRWETTDGVSNLSAYSNAIQAGDSLVRQWIKQDVPDADLTNTMWDRWRDMAFAEMEAEGLGRPAATQTLTPTGTNNDQWFNLNAEIQDVLRVDMYDNGQYQGWTDHWEQRGRKVRLFYPSSTYTYTVYGIGELRDYGDIDDDMFLIIYWIMRRSYLDYRIAQRANWKLFQVAERPDDTSTAALISLRAIAKQEVERRMLSAKKVYSLPARAY